MFYKFKKLYVSITILILFFLFSLNDFPGFKSILLDFSQYFNRSKLDDSIVTVNIDTSNSYLKRPFNLEQISLFLNKLESSNPKNIILMISPKEIIEDEKEKLKILNVFEKYRNLYLFSPFTNGPLGGFHADSVFASYPRHFRMPYTRDILFGPRDSKIRRVILKYERLGNEPFINQLPDLGINIMPEENFSGSFDLWDTTQIYQKTYKNGTFGQIPLSSIIESPYISDSLHGKTILLGTFDEFSIFISPSIFNFSGKLKKDNFDQYFFPINETAANVLNTLITGKHVKTLKNFNDLYISLFFVMVLFLFEFSSKKKTLFLIASIPFLFFSYIAIYFTTDIFLDFSKSMLFLITVEYFFLPYLLFENFQEFERKKSDLINEVRIDSFLSISEKIAHDIRSPLSTINLILSTLDIPEIEKKRDYQKFHRPNR